MINKSIKEKLSNPNRRQEKKTKESNLDITLRPKRLNIENFSLKISS